MQLNWGNDSTLVGEMVVMEPKNKVCCSDVREGILFKTIGIYTNFGDTDSWWYYHLSVLLQH